MVAARLTPPSPPSVATVSAHIAPRSHAVFTYLSYGRLRCVLRSAAALAMVPSRSCATARWA
eukprot:3970748-Amphidinium_carterae.1